MGGHNLAWDNLYIRPHHNFLFGCNIQSLSNMEQGICNQQMSDRNHIHLKNRAKLTFRFYQHNAQGVTRALFASFPLLGKFSKPLENKPLCNVSITKYVCIVDNIAILFRYENKVQPNKIVFSTSEPNITWKKYDFYSVFISTLRAKSCISQYWDKVLYLH